MKTMKVPVASCVGEAKKALQKAGFAGITSNADMAWGTTPTTRGQIVCIRLPKDGDCGGDGATAVMTTAGSDANKLVSKLYNSFVPPVYIDCGS
jgi:hypothetical protein